MASDYVRSSVFVKDRDRAKSGSSLISMKVVFIGGVFCYGLTCLAMPLFAADTLSTDEVHSLFSGQTVEGSCVGAAKHYGGPGADVVGFSEPFIMYFAADGTVYERRGEKSGWANGEWIKAEVIASSGKGVRKSAPR